MRCYILLMICAVNTMVPCVKTQHWYCYVTCTETNKRQQNRWIMWLGKQRHQRWLVTTTASVNQSQRKLRAAGCELRSAKARFPDQMACEANMRAIPTIARNTLVDDVLQLSSQCSWGTCEQSNRADCSRLLPKQGTKTSGVAHHS